MERITITVQFKINVAKLQRISMPQMKRHLFLADVRNLWVRYIEEFSDIFQKLEEPYFSRILSL